MTSSAHVADLKRKNFGRSIYPLSFVVIASLPLQKTKIRPKVVIGLRLARHNVL